MYCTNLCSKTLSNCSCFRSNSSSGRTPWHEILNTIGSGFSRIQQTTASSKKPGVLGYAHRVRSCQKSRGRDTLVSEQSLVSQIHLLRKMVALVKTDFSSRWLLSCDVRWRGIIHTVFHQLRTYFNRICLRWSPKGRSTLSGDSNNTVWLTSDSDWISWREILNDNQLIQTRFQRENHSACENSKLTKAV